MRNHLLSISVLLWSTVVQANTPQNMTPGEISRLPSYCADAQGMAPNSGTPSAPTPQQQRWVAAMGEAFWHIHHYCWALLNANRATQAGLTQQQRDHLYRWAISDCMYVLNLSTREFVLLPEIYLRMGQFAIKAGQPIDAIDHFENSRQHKADYWPPYIELSKLHVALRRPQEAEKVLKAGLAVMPDEPRLQEALANLNASKPEPAAKRPDRSARVAPK